MKQKDMLSKFTTTLQNEINDSIETMDLEMLLKARDIILGAIKKGNRVHVTGIGKPSYVAGYIASLLSSTGTPAYVLHGTEAVHGSSGQVLEGDVVIAISNSGETMELRQTVETLLRNEAIVVAVTRDLNSWLARHSSVTLKARVEQEGDTLNKPPRSSIIAETIVLQALSILLQEAYELDEQIYVKWHPGGALGASIKVEEK